MFKYCRCIVSAPVPFSFITQTSLLWLKSQLPPAYTRNMNTQFVLPTRPLWKKGCHLLSISYAQNLREGLWLVQLGLLPSLHQSIVGTACHGIVYLHAGTTQFNWGKNQFQSRCNKSSSLLCFKSLGWITTHRWNTCFFRRRNSLDLKNIE